MTIADRAIELIRSNTADTAALLQNWAEKLEGYAKEHASWENKTSHARQGIHAGVEDYQNELVLYLSHGMEYGTYLETGTPPHVIKPKNAKALYWRGAGHPVRVVHHPGSRPHAIIGPTLDTHLPRIKQTVIDLWRD